MKQPERVAELLAELRALTENDFERHRIDVLERDLHEPPTVEIIGEKTQRFAGFTFRERKDGHYWYNLGLHQLVWFYYTGVMSGDNLDVHHKDRNPANNDISNLQLLTASEHAKLHSHFATEVERICEYCGKIYRSTGRNGLNRFCSRKCRTDWQHANNLETRTCEKCGKEFFVRKDLPTRFCSTRCSAQYTHEKPSEERICVICGKKFLVDRPSIKTQCCSLSCGAKLASLNKGKQLVTPRKCVICGKEFTPSNKHTKVKTCSRPCTAKLAGITRHQRYGQSQQKVDK